MTLRHYGRALAAASGAVLLCATLSVPALATPSSDTGAAAPAAASATDEGSAPSPSPSRAPTPTETRCTKVT